MNFMSPHLNQHRHHNTNEADFVRNRPFFHIYNEVFGETRDIMLETNRHIKARVEMENSGTTIPEVDDY